MSRTAEEVKQDLAGLVDIPEDYCCPITAEIMSNPVVAADGHSYERAAIEQWIRRGKKNSPMTGQELAHRNLTPNHRLKSMIEEFRARLPQIQREQQIRADLDMALKLREEGLQQMSLRSQSREQQLLQQLEEERKERKALEERLKALELNQSPFALSSSSVAPLQFSNALSQPLPSTQASVATSSQSLNRAVYNDNDVVELYKLGEMYFCGQGVSRDVVKAVEYLEEAAARGHREAQFYLGMMHYIVVQDVPRDYAKARECFEKAAAQGLAEAQYSLGEIYHYSQGVAEDYAKACEWYEKAAVQGHAPSKACLAYLQRLAGIPEPRLSAGRRP